MDCSDLLATTAGGKFVDCYPPWTRARMEQDDKVGADIAMIPRPVASSSVAACASRRFLDHAPIVHQVKKSAFYLDAAEGPWNAVARLQQYKPKADKEVEGPALRERWGSSNRSFDMQI